MSAQVTLENRHPSFVQAAAYTFQALDIGVTLRDETDWHAIHTIPSVLTFEFAHGTDMQRLAYNRRNIARARRERKTVLTEHAGFWDFCVPIRSNREVYAVLLTGPFATARPTSADVLQRWHAITGRHGHPSDPEFAHYLSMTVGTLTLEGDQVRRYQRFLECYAMLSAGRGDARGIFAESRELGAALGRARSAESMWSATREMVDDRTAGVWLSPQIRGNLSSFGLSRLPEYALVGLLEGRRDEPDLVGATLRRNAFQRACVELARTCRVMCDRVGDHGVLFMLAGARSMARLRSSADELVHRASTLARRRFGFTLHCGLSSLTGSASLSTRYEQALTAAERALSEGRPVAHFDVAAQPALSAVRELRRQLGTASEARPQSLASRFERYIEAVAVQSGYRLDVARALLEAGFDRAAEGQLSAGALSESVYSDMCDLLDRAASDATTVSELFAAYRRAVTDLVTLAGHPARAVQDRSLYRAVTFTHRHFTEPLTVRQVAHRWLRTGVFRPALQATRAHDIPNLRPAPARRARQAAPRGHGSQLERVGQLSGFTLCHYFQRAFKQVVGVTPGQFRKEKR